MKFIEALKIDNLEKSFLSEMKKCHLLVYKNYRAGEVIMDYSDGNTNIGIVLSGNAELTCSEYDGKSYLLERYEENDLFGPVFSLTLNSKLYLVNARTDCSIVYFDYNNFITPCNPKCKSHDEILRHLFLLMLNRSKNLSLRLNLLCKGTIREQLLTYLEYNQRIVGTDNFTIPLTLKKLSEYLCVDRRSLMREIRKLNEEKLIRSSGRKFKLLYNKEEK